VMSLRDVQRNWDAMGRRNPLTAILTTRLSWEVGEFFETGRREVEGLLRDIAELDTRLDAGRALDFGCGVGRLTQSLADHYEEVVGVDIASSMIELAEKMNRHGTRCRYVLNERDDLRIFGGDHFDLIYSNITLQHMEPRYAFRYIKEFLRVLSMDGLLVFHLPSERTGRNTLDYLPRRASAFLQRLLLGGAMEMHGIEKNTLMGFIEDNGGTVLRVKPSDSAGGAWETYEYFVGKR
jgi:2-polyprenyl-3-methyl-5-hydroxy-6-metoxy-1,4-benzoquinol methylase